MTTKGEAAMSANGKCEVVRQFARRGLALAALLAIVPFAAGICRAQSSTASTSAPSTKAASAVAKAPVVSPPARPPASAPHEGIKVHGHWTIDVRDPDGRLASHTDFENNLCLSQSGGSGDFALAGLLTGNIVAGGWLVGLGSPALPPPTQANPPVPCGSILLGSAVQSPAFVLSESNAYASTSGSCSSSASPLCYPSLSVNENSSKTGVVLSGSFTVPNSFSTTTITAVGTAIAGCPGSTYTASQCISGEASFGSMTATYLTGVPPSPPAPTISGGQSVSVTVQISFQ